jgi:hypothetical protein
MKYPYQIENFHFPDGRIEKVVYMLSPSQVLYTLSIINHHYLNYYIQEIKKLIQGEELEYQKLPLPIKKHDAYQTEEQNNSKTNEIYVKPTNHYLEINISDEPDFEQHPDMSIIVTKDWTYPVEYDHNTNSIAIQLNANPNNKKIETTELLDFLLFTKKELSTEEQYKYLRTDEVVKPDLTYWKYYFSGGHHKQSLNNDRKILDIKNTDQHGVYLALQEKTFIINTKEQSVISSTNHLTNNSIHPTINQSIPSHTIKKTKWIPMFPDHWTGQKTIDSIQEAFENKKLISGNKYKGTTSEGVEVIITIGTVQGSGLFNKIITAYPIYKN